MCTLKMKQLLTQLILIYFFNYYLDSSVNFTKMGQSRPLFRFLCLFKPQYNFFSK